MKKYFEITTYSNSRPDHPEDNIVIVSGTDLENGLQNFSALASAGKLLNLGRAKSIREIHYVYDMDQITLK